MRLLVSLLALALSCGCKNEVEHPDLAPACDPETTDCGTYKPPMAGLPGGGNEAGAGSSDPAGATVSGDVLLFSDDFFDSGRPFSDAAEISAVGESGARVEGPYDGTSFELEDVLKDPTNWFMVEPAPGSGALPTVTLVDTRVIAGPLSVGVVSDLTLDGMFALVAAERSTDRAQVVVLVVDEEGRSVAGVLGGLTAEVVAYREAGGWLASDLGTDDSGMIFFGNVPATPSLLPKNITFSGAASARVEAPIKAGATTIVTAVVSPP